MTGTQKTAALPEWDLGDLYTSPDAPEVDADLTSALADARAFEDRHKGNLSNLDGDALAAAIAEYEMIEEQLGRLGSYAGLLHAANVIDPEVGRFQQNTMERINEISLHLLFFTLELNRIEEPDIAACLAASPALDGYRPWIDQVRRFRPHQLGDDMERMLHEKDVSGASAWTRLFDETMAAVEFDVADPATGDTQNLNLEETLNLLSDTDGARRKAASEALSATFSQNIRLFTLITNTLAKDKAIEDKWRAFAAPDHARHLSNNVEPEVVDALRTAVTAAYPELSHRYYQLKARWFGTEQLDFWDRNAPLPDDADENIGWPDARDMVLAAYRAFSPRLADVGVRFFENAWIDAAVKKGKAPGAFS
ncbi:MAG: hypothetical protein WEB93_05290, partial [Sphingomonadales bacterium]